MMETLLLMLAFLLISKGANFFFGPGIAWAFVALFLVYFLLERRLPPACFYRLRLWLWDRIRGQQTR